MPEGPLSTVDDVVVTGTVTPPAEPVVGVGEFLDFNGFIIGDGTTTGLIDWQQPIAPLRTEWIQGADADGAILARPPLADNATGTVTFEVMGDLRADLVTTIARFTEALRDARQSRGGVPLVWVPNDENAVRTYYVLSGEITELPTDHTLLLGNVARVTATLTCRPYWYASPMLIGPITANGPVMTMNVPDPGGDAPAEGTLTITDTAGQARRFVEVGTESSGFTESTPAPLLLDSDSLMTNGYGGVQGSTTGSYDPNASGANSIVHVTLATTPSSVCATGALSHIGSFRVWARVLLTNGVHVRMAWRTGDGTYQLEKPKTSSVPGAYTELDLGEIRIRGTNTGSQRSHIRLDAFTRGTGQSISVDYIRLVPTSDFYGKATSASAPQAGVLVAQDLFVGTTAGNALNARVAPSGGTWSTSGVATDFTFRDGPNAGDENVGRSTNVAEASARVALLGSTNYTDVQATVAVRADGPASPSSNHMLVLRGVDGSNYLRFVWQGASSNALRIETVVAGVVTELDRIAVPYTVGAWYQIEGVVYATGKAIGTLRTLSGAALGRLTVHSSLLATGGTLATGKPGIADQLTAVTTSAVTRYYDELTVSTIPPEPVVINANRRIEMRHDTTETQSVSGLSFAPPPLFRGGRFMVRPGRATRVAVTAWRDDVETSTMTANFTDNTQLSVAVWPRYYATS